MTSVKEFRVNSDPTGGTLGEGAFIFTDDYSVFDWGKMPDPIPDKGASLCTMGAKTFELLEREGIPTHYRGVVDSHSEVVVDLGDVPAPPREMAIELTQVPDLPRTGREYDYDPYHDTGGENYLIPLEIVFRNRVPIGSSLRRRSDPTDHGLAFEQWPGRPVDLPEPVIEFSTKYEESDRYLTREEADEIAGKADVERLVAVAREVNRVVSARATEAGLTHDDGKIECLYFQGTIRVADVTGTLDENRFRYDDHQVSKEVLRQYHKRTQSGWVEAVERAKKRAKETDIADWRRICARDPSPLAADVIAVMRDMYAAAANTYIGRDLFEAPDLPAVIAAIDRL